MIRGILEGLLGFFAECVVLQLQRRSSLFSSSAMTLYDSCKASDCQRLQRKTLSPAVTPGTQTDSDAMPLFGLPAFDLRSQCKNISQMRPRSSCIEPEEPQEFPTWYPEESPKLMASLMNQVAGRGICLPPKTEAKRGEHKMLDETGRSCGAAAAGLEAPQRDSELNSETATPLCQQMNELFATWCPSVLGVKQGQPLVVQNIRKAPR